MTHRVSTRNRQTGSRIYKRAPIYLPRTPLTAMGLRSIFPTEWSTQTPSSMLPSSSKLARCKSQTGRVSLQTSPRGTQRTRVAPRSAQARVVGLAILVGAPLSSPTADQSQVPAPRTTCSIWFPSRTSRTM